METNKMKLTNEILKEYLELEKAAKEIEKRMSEIKEAAKDQGSFSTRDCVVAVSEYTRESLAGLKEVEKVIDKALLVRHGLVKVTEVRTVKILAKEKAGAA
jgi:hypothetical protein